MVKLSLLLSFLVLLYPEKHDRKKACSCMDVKPFLSVAPRAKLVALVKIKQYGTFYNDSPRRMTAEIISIYKGEEKRKKITIWGDNGIMCRPYISNFALNKYYLIGLYSSSEGNTSDVQEKADHYFISSCGSYWLDVNQKDKTATGDITENRKQISLNELQSQFQ